MFGSHEIPLKISKEEISISVEKEQENLLYRRIWHDEKVEKILMSSNGKILINPVEPVNKPKEITADLLIEFEKAIAINPKAAKSIFLKFPVEIGIFIYENKDFEILDILTLSKQKFTLYGDPKNGVICKHWRSDVYSSKPTVNPVREGVMQLNITNTTTEWIQVNRVVFNAYGMKIYYSDDMVSMKAVMKVLSKNLAETDFIDSPLKEGMKKSLELYTTRKLPVVATKFVMEWGI